MFRKSIFLFCIFFFLASFGTVMLKVHVQNLVLDVKNIKSERDKLNNEIRVLKAEWSYLNNAERIDRLAKKHLGLSRTKIQQVRYINKGKLEETKLINRTSKDIRRVNTNWRYKSRVGILKISNKKPVN